MPLIGYARAANDQDNLAHQQEVLEAAGCTAIRAETLSRSTIDPDTELMATLNFLRRDDVLVVSSLDRLARSLADLIKIIRKLQKTGAHVLALQQNIDSRKHTTAELLNIIQGIAQFEVAIRRERQLKGINAAQKRGAYRGRKPEIDAAEIERRLGQGQGATAISREMGISRSSVYTIKNRMEAPATAHMQS